MIRRLQGQHGAGENRQRHGKPRHASQFRRQRGPDLPRDEQARTSARTKPPSESSPSFSVSVPTQFCQRLSRSVAPWTWLRTKARFARSSASRGASNSARRYAAMALPRWPALNSALAALNSSAGDCRAGLQNFFVSRPRRRQIFLRRKACSPPKNRRRHPPRKCFRRKPARAS